jgi:Tfp pilus assembly protein PilF
LEEAEKEYQQYKIKKADEEYRRSLLDIDSSILSSMKQQEMRKQQMRSPSAEEQKAQQEERRRRIDEAKAKEKAQMEAMRKLEDKSTTRTHRRKDNISPKRRKSIPLSEKAPEEMMQTREDVLKSSIELRNAGLEMQRSGDLDSAIKYYQQALLSDPNFATVHNDLGILYEQKGLDEKAKMEYLAALKTDPQYIKAHSNLALLYEKSGDNDKAYYHWKQRAQLGDPNDPWTEKAKQRMELLEQRK